MEGFAARPGEVLGERYRFVRPLGQGGMGDVWEAVHLGLDRHVALKILKPRFAQDGEVLLRFRREAQITAGLGHPKIVEVLDFVCGPGQPAYLVMELLQGQSLESALAERGCLAWPVALRVAVDVLDALGAAHAAGIVHRDMKPANIWLQGDLNEPQVKVLDFGVAQIADDGGPRLTRTNTTVGTPQYLPPEQIAGSRVDARADIWALGATLYETLAGRHAFVGHDFASLVGAILTQEPPPLRTLVPEVPVMFAAAITAALSKAAADRPATAEAMAAPLRVLLSTLGRKRGDDAFAATTDISSALVPKHVMGLDATMAVAPSERPPPAVPAQDSSPRLPGTRVHAVAPVRRDKRRKFGHAVVLHAPVASPAQQWSTGNGSDPALLSVDEDEPPVLPTLATGKWLLAALVFAVVAGGALLLFVTLGRSSPATDPVASAPSTGTIPVPTVAASGDAGTPSDAAPSTHVMPSSPDAATNLGTEPAATPPPESTPPPAPPPVVAAERPPHVSTPSTPHVSAPTTPRVDASTTPQVPVATRSNPSPAPAGPVATHLQRGAIGGTYDRWAAAVHIGAVESAANRCISRTHPAAGSGSYRVEVPPDGDVTQVTGGDPEVRQCLSRAFRIIRWSPPPGEVSQFVTIDYDAVP